MKYIELKSIGTKVSRMCFGTLTIGPLQRNFDIQTGSQLILDAVDLGVNFFDTAEIYGTYSYLACLKQKKDLVIATKSYSYDEKTAKESLEKYLKETGRERAELFLLHEQESKYTLKGHREAIDYFLKMQQKGVIGAFGISTHHIAAVKAALLYPEIKVIHPLINLTGIGIADGSRDEMLSAIQQAHDAGKDIYAMKPLGGGHLIGRTQEALDFVLQQSCIDAVAIGVQSREELEYNCAYFSGEIPSQQLSERLAKKTRRILIHDWCRGCGTCVKTCKSGALSLRDGKAQVDQNKCVFCGYCGRICPDFVIKVI